VTLAAVVVFNFFLFRTLGDPDSVRRGVAALALRDKGAAARPGLAALIGRLKDGDAGVRLAAAWAIAALGSDGAPAVDALIAVCRTDGEATHVLQAAAEALGRIGKAARSAIPALRSLREVPRAKWAADLAIARIEGTSPM
jgi:HEAT repeat protein